MLNELVRRVYVAAPYARRFEVRALHERLKGIGVVPTSSWADSEDADAMTLETATVCFRRNDSDVFGSHALLVLGYPNEGGEMFAEARLALMVGIPCAWVGRRILSSWRPGVRHFNSIDEAITTLGDKSALVGRSWFTTLDRTHSP
jgi:hypothetical protein